MRSIARRLATVVSQAPGLSGTPARGHSASATTSASCASSSARSTSRTMRARLATTRARSIRKTASIARCVSSAAMPALSPKPGNEASGTAQARLFAAEPLAIALVDRGAFLGHRLGKVGLELDHRAQLEIARARHRVGTALRPRDRLVQVLHFPDPEPRDQFTRLREGPVGHRALVSVERDPLALRARLEP